MAQVLILMSSPRKKGNTDRLANAFIKGIEENRLYHRKGLRQLSKY